MALGGWTMAVLMSKLERMDNSIAFAMPSIEIWQAYAERMKPQLQRNFIAEQQPDPGPSTEPWAGKPKAAPAACSIEEPDCEACQ